MTTVKRRRGGTQPDALSRDDVIAAAVAVVAADGLGALSVSAVARALGVSSPAVYHYVRDKDDLVRRVCEHVTRSVELPAADGGRWDDRIVAIVLAMDLAFARYPGVAAHVLSNRRPSKAVDRLDRAVLDALGEGGFDDDAAADMLAAMHVVVGGWLLGQRPTLRPGTMTRSLLERVVRWTLTGALAERDDTGARR